MTTSDWPMLAFKIEASQLILSNFSCMQVELGDTIDTVCWILINSCRGPNQGIWVDLLSNTKLVSKKHFAITREEG